MHHNDEPEDAAEANNVEMVVDMMEWPLPTTTFYRTIVIVIAFVLSSVVGGGNFDISTDLPIIHPSSLPTTMLPSNSKQL